MIWNRAKLAGAPFLVCAVSATAVLGIAGQADAVFTVNLQQVGDNVVATGSGSLDVSSFSLFDAGGDSDASLQPGYGAAIFGPANDTNDQYEGRISGPNAFGSSTTDFASAGGGDMAGIDKSFGFLYVPVGYASNSPLSDTSTWDNSTLESLGVTPGTYTWSWETADNTTDSFVLIASVPEPDAMGLVGFAAAALLQRRKR